MQIVEKELDCMLLSSKRMTDVRGWFNVAFCMSEVRELGIKFKGVEQLNHSFTEFAGVIRGLNYQEMPYEQAKIVRCTKGALYSVGLNINKNSPFFGRYCGFVLDAKEQNLMYLPRGYAHGIVTLVDHTELEYFTDNKYSFEHAKSIQYNDPEIGIDWSLNGKVKINSKIMSEKNRNAVSLRKAVFGVTECEN